MSTSDASSLLERALAIALDAHRGLPGKGGEPAILHPLRVMLHCATDDERVVAVLHDVIEDSSWTLDALREVGLDAWVIEAVDALSRRDGEDYDAYMQRAAALPLARRVKIRDLEDNQRRVTELVRDAGREAISPPELAALRQKLVRYARALDTLRSD